MNKNIKDITSPLGLNIQTFDDIRASIVEGFKIKVNTDSACLLGQFIDSVALMLLETQQTLQYVYNNNYWNTAQGTNLDRVASLRGIFRQQDSYTRTICQLKTNYGNVIPSGLIVQNINTLEKHLTNTEYTFDGKNVIVCDLLVEDSSLVALYLDNNFINISRLENESFDDYFARIKNAIADIKNLIVIDEKPLLILKASTNNNININSQAGIIIQSVTKNIEVISEVPGNIRTFPNTLTKLLNAPINSSVNNKQSGSEGRLIESDSEFRYRIKTILQGKAGGSTIEGIRASILNVEGVSGCRVEENDTDYINEKNYSPHSIACYVVGGQDYDVALTILASKAAGIATNGDTYQELEINNNKYLISFFRGSSKTVWIKTSYSKTNNSDKKIIEEAITSTILKYFQNLNLKDNEIIPMRINADCAEIAGLTFINNSISFVENGVYSTQPLQTNENDIIIITTSSISLVEI